MGREGLQGGDPEGFPVVRRRRDGKDLVPQLEARGEGAGREHDRRGAAGDDRRGRPRWRWRDQRGGVPSNHEEDVPLLTSQFVGSLWRSPLRPPLPLLPPLLLLLRRPVSAALRRRVWLSQHGRFGGPAADLRTPRGTVPSVVACWLKRCSLYKHETRN